MTKTPMSKTRMEFIARAGEHLKSMRAGLIHELASDIRAGRSSSRGGSLDSGELAFKELEQNVSVILSERQSDRITEIDHALKQMREANYGVCEACGLEIAEPRLEAMPFARLCRDCQHDQEHEAKTKRRGGNIGQNPFLELESNITEDEIG